MGPAIFWLWWTLVVTLLAFGVPVLAGLDDSSPHFRVTQPYLVQGLSASSGARGAIAVSAPRNS